MPRPIRLLTDGFPEEPGLDTAVGRALLIGASDGAVAETFRVHVPGRVVAFGKHDALEPGFRAAVDAAASAGFLPVLRLAGGRAAVFHEGTLAFHWTIPDPDPRASVSRRYDDVAALMVATFTRLGIDTVVGELPGEYCPGAHSVHVVGGGKVMGVGQRLARSAAHVGGVAVVTGGALVNHALDPVYRALGAAWDPSATGALEDAMPGLTPSRVTEALVDELSHIADVTPATIGEETLTLARSLVPDHILVRGAAGGAW
jgi:octanoyl-[GcvH]:protein N-octanoyltransferase